MFFRIGNLLKSFGIFPVMLSVMLPGMLTAMLPAMLYGIYLVTHPIFYSK
jgi:hypothetical protein